MHARVHAHTRMFPRMQACKHARTHAWSHAQAEEVGIAAEETHDTDDGIELKRHVGPRLGYVMHRHVPTTDGDGCSDTCRDRGAKTALGAKH